MKILSILFFLVSIGVSAQEEYQDYWYRPPVDLEWSFTCKTKNSSILITRTDDLTNRKAFIYSSNDSDEKGVEAVANCELNNKTYSCDVDGIELNIPDVDDVGFAYRNRPTTLGGIFGNPFGEPNHRFFMYGSLKKAWRFRSDAECTYYDSPRDPFGPNGSYTYMTRSNEYAELLETLEGNLAN